jgi:hypothetical protein
MATTTPLQRLKRALEAHQLALQELEDALVEYGETLPSDDDALQHPASTNGQDDVDELHLLSIDAVCNALGMGKPEFPRMCFVSDSFLPLCRALRLAITSSRDSYSQPVASGVATK